ncbi:hypothetical protein KY346_01880 [Candidatus Woesearchaeota archaeon]|nr:hypothetical protein [Candidatus Woesearchaeota archaeon]
MAFKEVIKKKVPGYVQATPEFNVFLALVKKENIKGPASLRTYLDANIKKIKTDIKEMNKANKEGTMTRRLRPMTKKLDFLMLVKNKILKYF